MDIHKIYQEDNEFDGEESLYYVLAGQGGSSRWSKNHEYYIITRSAVVTFIISVLQMKDNWRAGVQREDKTNLVMTGIYSISRNPAF